MSRIRVLIIDDSAFARKVIREVLERSTEIEVVGIARDGIEGLEKIAELKPDVITLDLMMPDLDGLGVLRALPKVSPPKAVVVSVSGSDTEIVLEALSNGAVDVVHKPTPLPTDRLYELGDELIEKVKAASIARIRMADPDSPASKTLSFPKAGAVGTKLVVIGTSTGGPQALTDLFRALPAGLPVSFAIALHIPSGYTAPLAARLSALGGMKVVEAVDGMELVVGEAVIAPGGMHLKIRKKGEKLFADVSYEPMGTLHHPSVDILFESASLLGREAVGVILTGMGSDGLLGAGAMSRSGGRILAESASSCVVYGMPRSVIEAGVTTAEAPLTSMPELILRTIF